MRVVYKIALGLLLFNTVFALFGPVFNSGFEADAKGVDDSSLQNLSIADSGPMDYLANAFGGIGGIGTTLGIAAVFTGVAVIAAFVTKNYIYIGIGLFMGILTSIYINFMNIISQLGTAGTDGNIYITGIITIIGIAIGLVLMFNIVDMFAPAPA